MPNITKEDEEFNKIVLSIRPHLNHLTKIYSIPFEEMLNVIKKDRDMAIENYLMFKEMINDEDDSSSAKEGLNKAMELIIKSSDKLNELVRSSSKLIGDSIKAMALENGDKKKEEEKKLKSLNSLRGKVLK